MRIFFAEGDNRGWAIDEDLRLLRAGLSRVIEVPDIREAEVVVAVWWWKLLRIPPEKLADKQVLALADNPPFIYVRHPSFLRGSELVDLWIGRSREAIEQFSSLGLPAEYAPYAVDSEIFRKLDAGCEAVKEFRSRWNIPNDRFLVGNFHRDTEGGGTERPKSQKAPEAFFEIIAAALECGIPAHPVLAGPRRGWLRKKFTDAGIPHTFVGRMDITGDDYPQNILPRTDLNILYNLIDLYLITSRWEGGPHSVLEAAAAECPVLSTPVGVANDLLPNWQRFSTVKEGVAKIGEEFRFRRMRAETSRLSECVRKLHTPERLGESFAKVLASRTGAGEKKRDLIWPKSRSSNVASRWFRKIARMLKGSPRVSLGKSDDGPAADFLHQLNPNLKFSKAGEVLIDINGEHLDISSVECKNRSVRICFSIGSLLEQIRAGYPVSQLTLFPAAPDGTNRIARIGLEETIVEHVSAPLLSREPRSEVSARFSDLVEMVAGRFANE